MVRSWLVSTTEDFYNPLSEVFMIIFVGYVGLSKRELSAATIVTGLWRFAMLFCMISAGRVFLIYEPMVGSKFTKYSSPRFGVTRPPCFAITLHQQKTTLPRANDLVRHVYARRVAGGLADGRDQLL